MKITGVKTTLYRNTCARRMGNAGSPDGRNTATACLVELSTDQNLTGIAAGGARVQSEIETLVNRVLSGRDPRGVTGLWQSMVEHDSGHGRSGLTGDAIAVLDQALWDLKAKAGDEPLWKTLGGIGGGINVYASDAGLSMADEDLTGWFASMAKDYGFREAKFRVGLDQEADLRRLGLVREALKETRSEPVLMIDADECWSPKQAIRMLRDMERQFDLTWVEAPAPRGDFAGLKRVSDSVRAAVCSGGCLYSSEDFLPHFHHHSLDVVKLDPARTGITGALQLADAAYGYELPVTLAAGPGNVHAHLAGALPYFMSLEVIDPLPPDGIFDTDVRIENGRARIGERPGNGLVIDDDALAKAAVDGPPEE